MFGFVKRAGLGLAMIAALVACGGGSDPEPPAASTSVRPEGVFSGSLSGGSNSAFQMLVLENGETWVLVGGDSTSGLVVSGLLQGSITTRPGGLAVNNLRDYTAYPALAGSASATFASVTSHLVGTVDVFGAATVSFDGRPFNSGAYDYAAPANLGALTGAWRLRALNGEDIDLTVQADGAFTATSSAGCAFTGQVTPRSSGKNVFDTQLTFGPTGCAFAGQTANGQTLAIPLAGGQTQLIVAVQNAARTAGIAAFGVR